MRVKRVAIIGAAGRMGGELINACSTLYDFELGAAVVSASSTALGKTCSQSGLSFCEYSERLLSGVDCVIDFSAPAVSVQIAQHCATHKLPLLIGTTGLSAEALAQIRQAAEQTAIVVAANTSIGIAALSEIASVAQNILGAQFDIELIETHHRHKKDAPSGTAKMLAHRLTEEGGLEQKFNREGARETKQLGISSLRGGAVFGDHTIHFLGAGERLELTHRAESRTLFADGAFVLMRSLFDKPVGLYQVRELLFSR